MHPAAIGPFKIERELGRGGMGEVYLARDTRLDRQVAIKALPAHLAQDPDRLARFQREAKVLASLNHPGIGAIYGLEEANGLQYLILEFVEGETLADRLAKGPIPVDEALPLARQIAEALEVAHEKGVIHRDLKPGNVMVTPDGVVKVLDFGLARTADGAPSTSTAPNQPDSPTMTSPARFAHSPTIPGVIMGTAGYMSPEQARGKPVDKRSDIFSFGCVLYEMLTGIMPFRGETVADAIGATLHKETDLNLLPPTTPSRVRDLLTKCLAKDKKNRLHDIGDARLEIEHALADPAFGRNEPGGAGVHWYNIRRLLPLGAALAAGVLLASAVWLAGTPRGRLSSAPGVERVSVDLPRGFSPRSVAISRDGKSLAFSGLLRRQEGAEGKGDTTQSVAAYVRAIDSYAFKALPLSSLRDPWAFAPDGQSIALVVNAAADTARKKLVRVAVSGDAPPLTIADLPTELTYVSVAWSADGEIVLGQESPPTILRVEAATGRVGTPQPLTLPGKSPNLSGLVELPGGAGLLAEAACYGDLGYSQGIIHIDPATGTVRALVADGWNPRYVPTGYLLFSRGESLLAVRCEIAKSVKLVGSPEVVASGLRTRFSWSYAVFDVSETGTLVHVPGGMQGNKRRTMVFDEAGKMTPWAPDERAFQSLPIVSPDGTRVATTVTNGSGINEVWVSRPDRSGFDRAVAIPNVDCDPNAFTPDGTGLVVQRVGVSEADNGLYLRDLSGGRPLAPIALLTPGELTGLFQSSFGPDGTSLFTPVNSGFRVHVKRFETHASGPAKGEVVLPDLDGSVAVDVSPDGKWLAWGRMGGERPGVFVAPMPAPGSGPLQSDGTQLSASPSYRIRFKATAPGAPFVLSYLDDKGRAFTGSLAFTPRPTLSGVKLTGDASDRRVFETARAILDDGRVVAVVVGTEEEPPTSASVVLNWFDDLRKKMSGK
ncbi:MAG: protein kinase [Planctomycetes bacterium]|nr:protein kinase [Planctomycetota bacterium]